MTVDTPLSQSPFGLSPSKPCQCPSTGSGRTELNDGAAPSEIRRAVLLGVGNILLTDEGVGVRLVEQLQAEYEIPEVLTVLDGGTAAMELLEDLENLDLLVIADCVRVGKPPASVVVLKDDEVPAFFRARISPHQVGLSDVLATLEITERAPRHVVVVGVQPFDISTCMEQSAPVRAAMPVALQAIRDALAEYGLQTPPKVAEAA